MLHVMADITRILNAIETKGAHAADQLLPLIYEELRRLAGSKLAREPARITLQATALVHEAFLRLVDADKQQAWNSRGHFFAAAAESMRRILVERARRTRAAKRGGDRQREDIDACEIEAPALKHDVLALNDALDRLEAEDAQAAKFVKLRYFAGLTVAQTAEALGTSLRTAERTWTYAKAWLLRDLGDHAGD